MEGKITPNAAEYLTGKTLHVDDIPSILPQHNKWGQPTVYSAVMYVSFNTDEECREFERTLGTLLTPEDEKVSGYKPSPFALKNDNADMDSYYRRMYAGKQVTLDGKPATITSVAGGTVAAVVSDRDSGEASWFKVHEVMTERHGEFRLSRGYRAV